VSKSVKSKLWPKIVSLLLSTLLILGTLFYAGWAFASPIGTERVIEEEIIKLDSNQSGDITKKVLEGAERDQAVSRALQNRDVKILQDFLEDRGYALQADQATPVKATVKSESETHQLISMCIPFGDKSESPQGQLLYMNADGKTMTGFSIKKKINDNNFEVEVYEPINGAVARTATAFVDYANEMLTFKMANGKEVSLDLDGVTVLSASTCYWCQYVCDRLLATGCGLSCIVFCAVMGAINPIAGLVCSAVCLYICVWGWDPPSCYTMCTKLGYCP